MERKLIEWNVFAWRDKLYLFNIFDHARFYKDYCTIAKICENKDDFAKAINSLLMYYFWGKCEWEITIDNWPCQNDNRGVKIDVYTQVMTNFKCFIDYSWAMKDV